MRSAAAAAAMAALLTAAAPVRGAGLRGLKPGDEVPAFTLRDARGGAVSLASMEGKPVVLCYLRPDHSYSSSALAAVVRVRTRLAGADAAFLAVVGGEGAAPPAKAPPFPVLMDPARELYGAWGMFVLPTTVVLDRRHRLSAVFTNYKDDFEDDLETAAAAAAGMPAKPRRAPHAIQAGGDLREIGLARRLLDAGQPQEALAALAPVMSSTEAACGLLLTAADARLRSGAAAAARADIERCLQLEPAAPRAALLMGRTLTLAGDYAAAEEWLKKGAGMTPDEAEVRFYLGDLYERTGRKDEALAAYRAGLVRLLRR